MTLHTGNPPSTLEELIAPLAEAEFFSHWRQRTLALVRGTDPDRFKHLLNWQSLLGMLERGEHPRGLLDVRLSKESVTVPIDRWLTRRQDDAANKIDVPKLEEYLAQGFSLVIVPLDRHAPPLAALCNDIKSRVSEQIKAGVIVTTGTAGAFKVHYDPEDLIILQVEGSKRWQIYGPPVSNPIVGMPIPLPPENGPIIFDDVLHPGDFLFVPAGNWHHCENGPGRSVHLGIFFVPPTSWHALRAIAADMVAEEMFRTPLTRLKDAPELAAIEADVKKRLIAKIDQMKLSEFIAGWTKPMTIQKPVAPDTTQAAEKVPAPAPAPMARKETSRPVTPNKEKGPSTAACRFLDNLTMASLVAPATQEEFRTEYWEKKPMIVHRGDPDYYDGLFSLKDFDEAISRSPSYVKMANAAIKKNVSYSVMTAPGVEALLADVREGGTLVLDQLHHVEPRLGKLCRVLGPEFGHRFQTNLYLTPSNGKGFTPHWDNHDVFILQVLGSKHWKIEKERRTFPTRSEQMGKEGRELQGELYTFTLEQGDIIYIPRGYVHAAECGAEPSLHITLGVTAIFFDEVLQAAVKAAVQRDPSLGAAMPLGFMTGPVDAIVSRAKTVLRSTADETFLNAVVEEFRDEMVKQFPLDVSGQFVEAFRPTQIEVDDVVGPRRGIVYRVHPGEDSVRLNFGTRSIVFLGIFSEALDFALKTPAFAIRDLPGELEDEERVVFIERLIEEGLVIRK